MSVTLLPNPTDRPPREATTPAPSTLPPACAIILKQDWYIVYLHPASLTLQCTCAEFRQERFCQHARRAWVALEPTRAHHIAPEAA